MFLLGPGLKINVENNTLLGISVSNVAITYMAGVLGVVFLLYISRIWKFWLVVVPLQ